MKLYNHSYRSFDEFQAFIKSNAIPNTNQVLIQIFVSNKTDREFQAAYADIQTALPNVSLIGTSTAGSISDGCIIDNEICLSVSVFDNTQTQTLSFSGTPPTEIVASLSTKVSSTTKLAIVFADMRHIDSPQLLSHLTYAFPQLAIVGGNAADDFQFGKYTLCSDKAFDTEVSIALLDSEVLECNTHYHMNWKKIGPEFTVTRSDGATVYEINGEPILEFYKKYLGEQVASNPVLLGFNFPLLFSNSSVNIARAILNVDNKAGAITYIGDIPQGTKVKFGFVDIREMEKNNQEDIIKHYQHYNEAAYIYSCAARKLIIGEYLGVEVDYLNNIAPTSGFITYGEYYHDQDNGRNELLNITTSYVVLNESTPSKKLCLTTELTPKETSESLRNKVLLNFINVTGQELDENIHYLAQFKQCVDEAAILSTTDDSGQITSVNKNFTNISGFSADELIGKTHHHITHPETSTKVRQDVEKTVRSGKQWKGLVKNIKKDGTPYYVLLEASPILNKDGSFKEFLFIRNDVTELQEYRKILEEKLDTTTTTLKEKIHYANQYEDAVNSSIAVVRTNTDYKVTYANKKMLELSGYAHDELIGAESSKYRHKDFLKPSVHSEIRTTLNKKQRIEKILTNVTKDGEEYRVSNLFVPILDLNGNLIEHITFMHDITDITKLSDEILETQKEVVYTLGAIGESRSKETGMHVKRVAEYSYLLAKLYGLDDKEAELLKQASPMHDIGKVAIPDDILNKPGKLTAEEFETMKTHTVLGYEMLKHSQRSILKASAIVAHQHHEKWDGSGYPQGIAGKNIHIYGRITAVADVFDALAQQRPYKRAWSISEILELFKQERGQHFDPQLIDLFLENLDAFLEIKYTLK